MMNRMPPPDPSHVFHNRHMFCAKCGYGVENEMAKLDKRVFHVECFVCHQCRNSLAGKKVHTHEDNYYDEECYLLFGAKRCDTCHKPIIGENEQYIKKKEKMFHYDCYVCTQCGTSLSHKRYHQDGDKKICQNCVTANRFNPPPSDDVPAPMSEEL